MPTTPKTPLALLVQVEERHNAYRAVARVVLPQPDGELHTPNWRGYGDDADAQRFDGLEIAAYAGSQYGNDGDNAYAKLWGYGVHYSPFRIENAAHATAIAKVLTQIERGMANLSDTDGYVKDGEFARYVMRVARTLRIKDVYVRSLPRQFAMSGERYRLADYGTLEYWTEQVTEHIVNRDLATLTRG